MSGRTLAEKDWASIERCLKEELKHDATAIRVVRAFRTKENPLWGLDYLESKVDKEVLRKCCRPFSEFAYIVLPGKSKNKASGKRGFLLDLEPLAVYLAKKSLYLRKDPPSFDFFEKIFLDHVETLNQMERK